MPFELNHTIIIIAVTCVISYMAFSNLALKEKCIFFPPAVNDGQFYRLVTHGFIHADGAHLLFNMFTLYFFGSVIEMLYRSYLGGTGFILFYLTAIIAAIIPSYLAHKNDYNYASLGASGAVSAVLFTYILIAPWSMLYIFGVVPIPAIIFAIAYTAYSIYAQKRAKDNVNHSAHLWGAAYGIVVSIIINPKLLGHFIDKLFHPSFL